MVSRIISRLFNRKSNETPASQIYGSAVAQSRIEALFTRYNIPDTVIGRSDMLALHVFLVNHRLKIARKKTDTDKVDKKSAELSQSVFDLFLDDLERGLRELGFADTSVHKRKKRLTRSYYALIEEFDGPIECDDNESLAKPIAARYYADATAEERKKHSLQFAQYILNAVKHLDALPTVDILHGNLDWPGNLGEAK